jgi:hypothetical protein
MRMLLERDQLFPEQPTPQATGDTKFAPESICTADD